MTFLLHASLSFLLTPSPNVYLGQEGNMLCFVLQSTKAQVGGL